MKSHILVGIRYPKSGLWGMESERTPAETKRLGLLIEGARGFADLS